MPDRVYRVYRPSKQRRVWRIAAIVIVLTLGGLAGSGAWLARAESGHLPPGVEIGGLAVGGLTVEEARARLEREAAARAAEPIELVWPGGRVETSGAELGADASIDEALALALESRDRLSRLTARLGLGDKVEIPLAYEADRAAVRAVLARVRDEIEQRPRPARVAVREGEVVVRPARIGRELDVEAALAALETLPARVELTVRETQPAVGDEAAAAAKATADVLLESPPAVMHKRRRFTPPRALLLEALRFRRTDGTIAVELDPSVLEQPLARRFGRFEREPKDASFRVRGERVAVVEAKPGRRIAAERIAAALVAGAGTEESIPAVFEEQEADLTTEEAKELRIRELVSEFATPYACCPPRVTNIKRAAEILDGTIIPAGARFSLNEAMGERTPERGFVPAPMIAAGRLVDAVGGGVSQVATTFYNAAFFAGLELIQATPHEFYISRYPMGREATVSWGGPELVFRNDWPAAILVKVIAADTSITVRFYSAKLGRRVETQTFEPYAYTSARTIRILNRSLPPGTEKVVQHGGVSGFTVEYTRKVYRRDRLLRDERYTVRYRPENTIVEYGPKKPKEEKPKGSGSPGGAGGGSAGGGAGGGSAGGGSGGSTGGGGSSGGSGSGGGNPPPADPGSSEPPPPPPPS